MNHFSLKYIISKVIVLPFDFLRLVEQLARNAANRFAADLHPSAKILPSAKIFNIQKKSDAISVGSNSVIVGELLTFGHGGKIEVGAWSYIGEGSRIWSAEHVLIGDRVLISHNVNIHDTDGHPLNMKSRHEHFVHITAHGHPRKKQDINSKPIVIGDDVWIGFNSVVLKGVRIGSGSVVAAGSTVTSDLPPNSLFVKNEIIRTLA